MDNIDLEVLKTCKQWMHEGHRCELVTVVKTWGSSPRPPGALLALCDDGRVMGSVSGGCIEDDLIASVREHGMLRTMPEAVTYGIDADQARRFGLPCGGTLQLVIEPITVHSRLDELLKLLDQHHLVTRLMDLETGKVELRVSDDDATVTLHNSILTCMFGPRWRLLIIWSGQMSRLLAQMAHALGYRVTVCDPREEHATMWDEKDALLVRDMPDDVVLSMVPDRRTAVVALTHDPKLDDLALMEALKSDAFYVGAIGSRVNNERRRARLREFDLDDAQLARLHGPVGLYIGSRTPGEIAVSIMAEITAVKNGVMVPPAMDIAVAKASREEPNTSSCVLP